MTRSARIMVGLVAPFLCAALAEAGVAETVGRMVATYVGVAAEDVAPTVTSVEPNYLSAADNRELTIKGTLFETGASVSFGADSGITVVSTMVLDATTLLAVVNVEAYPSAKYRDVIVTNPSGGSGTLSEWLYVSANYYSQPVTLHAPWFYAGGDFKAIVEMRNTTGIDIEVTPTIVVEGDTVVMDPRTIQAQGCDSFDIRDLLPLPGGKISGGVEIGFEGPFGSGIVANVSNFSETVGTGFDSPFWRSDENWQSKLHCPWFFVGAPGFESVVEMKNTSDSEIEVTVNLYTKGATAGVMKYEAATVTIPARESRSLALKQFRNSLQADFGGVELVSSGGGASLVANVTSLSNSKGLSFDAACQMGVDEESDRAATDAPNALILPWFYIGSPDYYTVVEMKNTSATDPVVVSPIIHGQKADGSVATVNVPPVTLAPHQTSFFNVKAYQASLGSATYGGVHLFYQGDSSLVVANATTLSFTTGYSFDAAPTRGGSSKFAIDSPYYRASGDYQGYIEVHNSAPTPVSLRIGNAYPSGELALVNVNLPGYGTTLLTVPKGELPPTTTYGCSRITFSPLDSDSDQIHANMTVISPSKKLSFDAPFEGRDSYD